MYMSRRVLFKRVKNDNSRAIRTTPSALRPRQHILTLRGQLPAKILPLSRQEDSLFIRRAELDYVDYRNTNGVADPANIKNGTKSESKQTDFAELDKDVEQMEKAKPSPGIWTKLSQLRSHFSEEKKKGKKSNGGEALLFLTCVVTLLALFPPFAIRGLIASCGHLSIAYGLVAAIWGVISLGNSLSPFAVPKADAKLVTSGIYRYVRHPIYSGLLGIAIGLSIITGNEFRMIMTGVLFGVLDQTMKGEEKDLGGIHPEYESYKKKVAKLVPFVY